jgi:hypothetical protein
VVAYASRTTTKRNLALLRDNGWRLMLAPGATQKTDGMRYALDNGAWRAFKNGSEFDAHAFAETVAEFGPKADFIVVPDIVCGGLRSLRFSETWIDKLLTFKRLLLLPVQDGMVGTDVASVISDRIGIFVGGSSEWKVKTLPTWADLAHRKDVYIHCGRVNTRRRIRLCKQCDIHSFDGSGVSIFAEHFAVLQPEIDQLFFRWGLGHIGQGT